MIINKHVQKSSNIKYSNIKFDMDDMEHVTQATSFTMPNTESLSQGVLGHPKTYFAAILRLSLPAMPLAASISNTCVMGVTSLRLPLSPNHHGSNVAIFHGCCYMLLY
jgi:hypothetical protein